MRVWGLPAPPDQGHDYLVVAASLIPRKPGERIKTDRRNATALSGEPLGSTPAGSHPSQWPKRLVLLASSVNHTGRLPRAQSHLILDPVRDPIPLSQEPVALILARFEEEERFPCP